MLLNFYVQNGEQNRVNKSANLETKLTDISATPLHTESILQSHFELEYNANIYQSNYFYNQQTGRYYFITNIQVDTGGRMHVYGWTDVLYTAKQSIYNSPAWVTVSSGTPDSEQLLLKNDFPFRADSAPESWEFPNSHFTKSFSGLTNLVLVTI